jgi:hypothetical protein
MVDFSSHIRPRRARRTVLRKRMAGKPRIDPVVRDATNKGDDSATTIETMPGIKVNGIKHFSLHFEHDPNNKS